VVIAQYGWIFGLIWFTVNLWALLNYDPTDVDPEIEKLWNDNF